MPYYYFNTDQTLRVRGALGRSEAVTGYVAMPLLQVSALNERLREVRGAKMAVDVLQYAASLGRAVQFVCGNTLVCDTVKEAQHVAFGGPERLKVNMQGNSAGDFTPLRSVTMTVLGFYCG